MNRYDKHYIFDLFIEAGIDDIDDEIDKSSSQSEAEYLHREYKIYLEKKKEEDRIKREHEDE